VKNSNKNLIILKDLHKYQYFLKKFLACNPYLQREALNPVEETEGILSLLSLRLECDIAKVTWLLYRMENEAKGKITRNVSGKTEAETVEQVFASLFIST
jgi:hypothetical protein